MQSVVMQPNNSAGANRMQGIPDKVIDPTVVRKTTVACIVCQAPPPCKDDTLSVPVECPKSPFDSGARIGRKPTVLSESFSEWVNHPTKLVNDDSAEDIPENIEERFECVPLVKMFRHN